MGKDTLMKAIQWIKIISVLAIFGIMLYFVHRHMSTSKTLGVGILAILLTFIEWWIPLPFLSGGFVPRKVLPWTQVLAWAASIWVVIGFAVWLLY